MANLLDKASIIITPTAYDVGSINAIKPKESPYADLTFDRGTSATQTRVDSNGNVSSVSQDVPRLDFEGDNHWLIEPSATNLLNYSEDFSQYSGGTKVGGFPSPDGGNNAYKLSYTGSAEGISFAFNATNLLTHKRSIWAKTVSGTGQLHLCSFNGNTNNLFTVTNEWQRFEVEGLTTSTGANGFYAADFRGSSTLTEVYVWGAQAELSDYVTSYIPTNGSSVTRDNETAKDSGNSTMFGQTEGVLYAEIATFDTSSTQRVVQISDNSSSTEIQVGFNSNGNFNIFSKLSNTTSISLTSQSYNADQFYKIAIRYKSSDSSVFIDGTEVATSTTAYTNTDTISELNFGAYWGGISFYGKVKCIAVFKEGLTDTELQCLTS